MRRRTGFGWMELIIGILLIILGIFTLINPGSTLTGVVIIYGLFAMLTGISDIIFYVKTERYMGIGPTISLISGILSVMCGLILLVYPGAGKWAIALFFPVWFIAHCISRLTHLPVIRIMAGNVYYYLTLIINILGLVLGLLMVIHPAFSIATLGIIIGIYLILLGIDSVVTALSNIGTR